MATINLLNSHAYVFIFIVVVGVIIISIYTMIKPETTTVPFRMNPFPKMAPTDLPDPVRSTDNCWNKLTPCDQFGNCSSCSAQEYKCQTVSASQAENKKFHFNGINVPEGQWCIPKDQNPAPNCNEYTGRWLWVFDPVYCANKSTNGQCWKCECIYPTMFASPEDGCSLAVACQNDSSYANSATKGQSSQLVSRFTTPTIKAGCVWDPTKPPDPNCKGIYQYTPYDKDKDGNPLFSCNCSTATDNQYFTQLPGDPYSCHLDPCFKYMNYTNNGYDKSSNSCNCNETNFTKSPGGIYKNTCVLTTAACGSGGYVDGSCQCGGGPLWPRSCKSALTQINIDQPNLPDCAIPQNALGSECINPCEGQICNHGGVCLSCGPDSYKGVQQCKMSESGTVLSDADASKIHATCDCSVAGPVPIGSKTYGGFFGSSCQYLCQKGGTVLDSRIIGLPTKQGNDCNCCCSQNEHSEGDYYFLSHTEVCSDGFPSIDSPADPYCSPVRGDCPDN